MRVQSKCLKLTVKTASCSMKMKHIATMETWHFQYHCHDFRFSYFQFVGCFVRLKTVSIMSDTTVGYNTKLPKKRPWFGRVSDVKKKILNSSHEIGPDCHVPV